MAVSSIYLVFLTISWSLFFTNAIQPSQKQVLLQIRKQLEYPKQLDFWVNTSDDFCYLSSPQVNITCENNFVTELKIMGFAPDQQPKKVLSSYNGFPIPSQTLSQNFSMDSLIATLSRLSSLKVLSLVSLGIWGPLPNKIQRLYTLEYIDLSYNFLYGAIPPTFTRLASLQSVNLDGNFLNASFPDRVDLLSNLTSLSLNENGFTGPLPDVSNLPNSLVILYLSKNSFYGQIPVKYGQLNHLQELDVSFNTLTGVIPPSLFSLPYITYLNLSSNNLTGQLPSQIQCGNKLAAVDISLNRFTGGLPSCLANAINNRIVKYNGNCLMIDVKNQHPSNYCVEEARGVEVDPRNFKESKTRKHNPGIIVGLIVGSVLVLVLLVFGFVVLFRKVCVRGLSDPKLLPKTVQDYSVTGYPSDLLRSARLVSATAKLGTEGVPVHRLFSFEELKDATDNFHRSNLIGEGSTGKIYKGKLANGTDIAIRHLTVSKKYTIRNLKLRLDLLARLRHPHLVCLLGHCVSEEGQNDVDSNKVYLVYEYVHNGNYRSIIAGNDPQKVLLWEDRLRVLTGVAKAVHFLHTGLIPGFFNNRLKANNILLNENGMAKLSDYGLSIIADDIKLEDENGEGVESWKMKNLEDDVYSFGFILLESLVGPSAASRKDEFLMNEMASFETEVERKKVVDPVVLGSCAQESLSVIISITKKCFCGDSWARPSFEDVLWHLQYAAQVQANAQRPAQIVSFNGC
ncbi:probable inactive leucine-rich repeat receptor-like protein kinase At3g03770 [Rutidosis leptorrhynchoides]|uniref:probable inactive leucine-rich repeat receptor-like protein kinase At3g03770 n=1 Tax=Rutidosis leptorrhynchoides TaxID=125765 RepID=UPI003A99E84B